MVIIKYSGGSRIFFVYSTVLGILMSKRITYGAWFRAIERAGERTDLDPRLVALVQFMARRAAEQDFAALCADDSRDTNEEPKNEESPP